MGWSVGYDNKWKRDIGYGIVAFCDHPDCNEQIDRGLAYVCCDQQPRGGDGCGLYFCGKHRGHYGPGGEADCCERCGDGKKPFAPKPEHPLWIRFKMLDPSWKQWREECPDEFKEFEAMWEKLSPEVQAGAEKMTQEEMES